MTEIYSASLEDTNFYIIKDKASSLCAAIDCCEVNEDCKRLLKEAGAESLEYILLTHGHFDHICGAAELKRLCGGKICISRDDAPCLRDEYRSFNAHFGAREQEKMRANHFLKDGEILKLGETRISVLATPGHTMGSVCFYVDGALFSGDTLFNLSVGRSDLGGDAQALRQSLKLIREKFDDVRVYPGHGPETTLSYEKENNPYLTMD